MDNITLCIQRLLEWNRNKELFAWDESKEVEKYEIGRRFIDDKLLVQCNGKVLPIFSCHNIPKEKAEALELKIIF